MIRDVLSQKCAYKGIDISTLVDMEGYKDDLQRNWEPMLAHQLPTLPSLNSYWDALPEFFERLEGKVTQEKVPLGVVSGSGEIYRPMYGQLGLRALNGNSLEIIRFAAGNRLCVNLDYTDNNGRRSTRIIEPYSLRKAKNGNILLYAVRAEDGNIRAYKIDQINDASITDRVFAPRYQVELSPSGVVPVVDQSNGMTSNLNMPRKATSAVRSLRQPPRQRATGLSKTPTYIYKCPHCEKKFRRKSHDFKINSHKNKGNYSAQFPKNPKNQKKFLTAFCVKS